MILEKLRVITKAILGDSDNQIDFDSIQPESRLVEDVCLNSISMLMLVIGIEDEFNIELPIKEAAECVTVGDIIEIIRSCIDAKA